MKNFRLLQFLRSILIMLSPLLERHGESRANSRLALGPLILLAF